MFAQGVNGLLLDGRNHPADFSREFRWGGIQQLREIFPKAFKVDFAGGERGNVPGEYAGFLWTSGRYVEQGKYAFFKVGNHQPAIVKQFVGFD